jgi:hypothetical protein
LRYVGDRFEGRRMPLDVLPDLSAFRDLLVSFVKLEWRAVHVNRERLPKGFEKSISFDLVDIGDGSAVPKLEWDRKNAQMLLPDFSDELEDLVGKSYSRVLVLFDGAAGGQPSSGLTSENIRALNRFGSGLLARERIEFPGSSGADGNVVYLDSWRRKLLITRAGNTYQTRFEDVGKLLGSEVDPQIGDDGSILVRTEQHGTIRIPISRERVLEEFDGCIDADVQFRLLIELDNKDVFRGIVDVFDVDVIDAAVVANLERCKERISGLRALEIGWHDGNGLAISSEAAATAARLLTARPSLSGSYHIYPMDDGGLLFEFVHTGWDYSIEIKPQGAIEIYGVQVDGPEDIASSARELLSGKVAPQLRPGDLAAMMRPNPT